MFLTSLPKVIENPTFEMRETLSTAKINVSLASVMVSYMMYRCSFYFIEDHPQIETAGAVVTDKGNIIFIDKDFWLNKLQNNFERAFIVLHEVLHIYLRHGERFLDSSYNPQAWGYATDYHINLVASGTYRDENGTIQKNDSYTNHLQFPKIGGLYDEKYLGMNSDEIYREIMKNAKSDSSFDEGQGGTGGDGKPFDNVYFPQSKNVDGDEDGEGQGNGEGQGDNPGNDLGTPAGIKDQLEKNRIIAVSAANLAKESNRIGANEAGIYQSLVDMAKPKFSYRDILENIIDASVRDRVTYMKPSLLTQGRIVFPSYEGNSVNIIVAFDSSGSMGGPGSEEYKRVAGEIAGVTEQFDSWKLRLISCDVAPYVIGEFTEEDGDSEAVKAGVTFKGGGGTELSPLADYAFDCYMNEDEDINAIIILTDGYIPEGPLEESLARLDGMMERIVIVTEGGNNKLELENARVLYCDDH